MGVKKLWSIIDSVKQRKSLADLRGQVVAVDLSIWIMEAQTLTQLQHLKKPHLRHVFFRVSHLLHIGVVPVIVVEGIPPDLKQATMQRRRHGGGGRRGGRGNKKKGVTNTVQSGEIQKPERKLTRVRFNAVHKECCEMLECLGVTWVQSHGEAEAMCAHLNRVHLVDGCITNDGDVFLYGATTVYRNFTINIKDPHVYRYEMSDVENKLRLSRDNLVGLAVILGCDYLPGGLPGVGRDMFFKLIAALPPGRSLLDRFDVWLANGSVELFGVEKTVARKAGVALSQLPYKEVIDEFLVNKDKYPNIAFEWKRPKMFPFMWYAMEKMEWPDEYSYSKILPLVTKFDMKRRAEDRGGETLASSSGGGLQPRCIVKSRVRQGVACFQVLWHGSKDCPAMSEELCMTIEEQALFTAAYPEMTQQFITAALEKQTSKKSKKKGAKQTSSNTPDSLLERLARIELADPIQDIDTAIHPAPIDFPSRRLDNPRLESPRPDIRRAPLEIFHRRRSKSVSSFSPRNCRPSLTPRRDDVPKVRLSICDEKPDFKSSASSNDDDDDEVRNYSDSENIGLDTRRRLREKTCVDVLDLSSERFRKDLLDFECDFDKMDLCGSDSRDSGESICSRESDGGQYRVEKVFCDNDESNVDLFDDSFDFNSACDYVPLSRRLELAVVQKSSELVERISNSICENLTSSSKKSSKFDFSSVCVAPNEDVVSGAHRNGHNYEAFHTPVRSSNKPIRGFLALTPWSESNVGRFDIETSMLNDLPFDCSSSATNDLNFTISRDQFDSSSDDSHSEEDFGSDNLAVVNRKEIIDNSRQSFNERIPRSWRLVKSDIQMQGISSKNGVSQSGVINHNVITANAGQNCEETINCQNSVAPATPRVLSLAERLAQKLGGQKTSVHSNNMDALVAMLK